MKPSPLQQPIRLDRWFWAVYLVSLPVVLWLSLLWNRDMPLYAKIAGALVLPFLFSISIYAACRFGYIIFVRRALEKGEGKALLVTMAFIVIACWAKTFLGIPPVIFEGAIAFAAVLIFSFSANAFGSR